MSVGFSAFNTNSFIEDIAVGVRVVKDIRVTGVNIDTDNTSSDVITNYLDYNVNNISSEVYLPSANSFVTYRVSITNFEDPIMGIFDITGLSDNLEYYISGYTLKEKLCDDNNKCNLGMTKDIYITIKYKDNMYDSSNYLYNFTLLFDFRSYHTINYKNIYGVNYPTEVIDGDNLVLDLDYNDVNLSIMNSVGYIYNLNTDYEYVNGSITIPSVKEDLYLEVNDKILITNVTLSGDTGDVIKYFDSRLNSSVELLNDVSSQQIFNITLYNSTNYNYVFSDVIYDEDKYDNENIEFVLSGLKKGDIILAGESIQFSLIFKYVDGVNLNDSSNILNSFINFLFLPRSEVQIVSFIYNGETTKNVLDLGVTSISYSDNVISNGVVARCNKGAVPTYNGNIITATGISDGTECGVFDTLKEAVDTADSTENNMLMIADHPTATEQINVTSSQVINLDINGKKYTGSNGILINYGILKIYDSLYVESSSNNSGYMKSSGVSFTNYNDLTIDSVRLINELNSELSQYSHIIHCIGGNAYINSSDLSSEGNTIIDYTGNLYSFIQVKDSIIKSGSLQESPIYARNSCGCISIINSKLLSNQYGVKTASGGRIYLAGTTIEAPYEDWLSYGAEDRLYYTSNNTFINNTSPTIYGKVDGVLAVKNYISTTDEDWIYVKNSDGNKITYSNGDYVLVGDPVNIMSYYGYALDVASGNLSSGSNLQLYTSNNTSAQNFMFLASSNTEFNIAPYYAPTLFMDISGASKTNGSNIRLYTQNNTSAQKYSLVKSGNYFKLNSGIGTYVDTDEGTSSVVNGTNVESWSNASRNSQLWYIQKVN